MRIYWKRVFKSRFNFIVNESMTNDIPTAAIQALKRKKRFEKQLQQIDGTLATIEMQREALEGANTNTAVLTNMKSAADALKAAHQHMYVIQVNAACCMPQILSICTLNIEHISTNKIVFKFVGMSIKYTI